MASILLIDDSIEDLLLMRRAIIEERRLIDVEMVRSGAAGVERLLREPLPDLILLDVRMPRGDGFETLSYIREKPECAHIPVIIFTGAANDSDRGTFYRMGANAYMTKPTNAERFKAMVNAMVLLFIPLMREEVEK